MSRYQQNSGKGRDFIIVILLLCVGAFVLHWFTQKPSAPKTIVVHEEAPVEQSAPAPEVVAPPPAPTPATAPTVASPPVIVAVPAPPPVPESQVLEGQLHDAQATADQARADIEAAKTAAIQRLHSSPDYIADKAEVDSTKAAKDAAVAKVRNDTENGSDSDTYATDSAAVHTAENAWLTANQKLNDLQSQSIESDPAVLQKQQALKESLASVAEVQAKLTACVQSGAVAQPVSLQLQSQNQISQQPQVTTPQPAEVNANIAAVTSGADSLSAAVLKLESAINTEYSGTIGANWSTQQTQIWLSGHADAAAKAARQIVGTQLKASFVVAGVSPGSPEITAHLIPTVRHDGMTNADRFILKPFEKDALAATIALHDLNSQWAAMSNQHNTLLTDIHGLQDVMSADRQKHVDTSWAQNKINDDQATLDKLEDQGWILQHKKLPPAQDAAGRANQNLSDEKAKILAADQIRATYWGQILIHTSDPNLLQKPVGTRVDVSLLVTKVSVSVVRVPDGATWMFNSDSTGIGANRLPNAPDDSGMGSVLPDPQVIIVLGCADAKPAAADPQTSSFELQPN